jgi:hypothetical protein
MLHFNATIVIFKITPVISHDPGRALVPVILFYTQTLNLPGGLKSGKVLP